MHIIYYEMKFILIGDLSDATHNEIYEKSRVMKITGGLSAPVQTRQVNTIKNCPVICIVLMVWIDRLDDEEGR